MDKIVINGLFLVQQESGVQRFAKEILKELDKIVDFDIEILIPKNSLAYKERLFTNITIVEYGKNKGRIWENIDYPHYLRLQKATGLNLCNTAPLFNPGIIVIHDVGYKNSKDIEEVRTKWAKMVWRDFQNKCYFAFAKRIITVSQFSKNEILKFFKPKQKIDVIYNSWQHYKSIESNNKIINNNGLKKGSYFFALSNLSDHKNFVWILKVAAMNPTTNFVISGGANPRYFKFTIDVDSLSNVKYLGRVTDSEAKALMENCFAFISPSLYEGFGIPPLEALSVGANIIVSDIPAHREVFKDAAVYINPRDYNYDLSNVTFPDKYLLDKCLGRYSWETSARKLYDVLKEELHA